MEQRCDQGMGRKRRKHQLNIKPVSLDHIIVRFESFDLYIYELVNLASSVKIYTLLKF